MFLYIEKYISSFKRKLRKYKKRFIMFKKKIKGRK